MFNKHNGRKKRKLDMSKHKAMRIPDRICQNNKNLPVIVIPIKACRIEFDDHLWLPFLDQPQSDVVVFVIFHFDI